MMNFAIFAIAFILGKMYRKAENTVKKRQLTQKCYIEFANLTIIIFFKEK
jgi:hypothetical protein